MRLTLLLYSIIGSALAGSAVIAVLSLGYVTLWPILVAAAVGAMAALPVSLLVAREIS